MVILFSMVVGFERFQTNLGIWWEAVATLRQLQREWAQSLGHYLDYEAQMVTLVVEDRAPFKQVDKKRTF